MQIPFNDFVKEYHSIKIDIDKAIQRVLESGWYVLGKEVQAFEEEFAKYIGTQYCVSVANGTEAIALALMAIGVGQGDEVITTNMTAFPTATGIMQTNAKPVVVDIDPKTGLIDPSKIEAAITPRTKAILPVHIYGQSADMDTLMEIAKKHNLQVIEDCAQSTGAKYKEKMTGTIGCMGTFSYYPTKNLGAIGDGGAITINSKEHYEKLLKLRNYGQSVRYYHVEEGINSRLDELQAAILRAKMKHLEKNVARRREIANMYNNAFTRVEYIPEAEGNLHSYHLYVIKVKTRENFMDYMKNKGIATIIHYPVPINEQQAFPGQKDQAFPATVEFTQHIVSLPIYPELTNEEVNYIIDAVNNYKE